MTGADVLRASTCAARSRRAVSTRHSSVAHRIDAGPAGRIGAFGARYDQSPIIISDGVAPPSDAANVYVPSACPGGRAPHLWLTPHHSLFDSFGFEWTLLRLSEKCVCAPLIKAAVEAGIELKVLDVVSEQARDIYGADLVLIRPDQVVAWRSNQVDAAETIFPRVLGSPIPRGSQRAVV